MANSFKTYVGDGSQTQYTFNFDYIADDHIAVQVDGVDQDGHFTLPSKGVVSFDSAPASGTTIQIERKSSRDARLVDFTNGYLPEEDLDTDSLQAFFLSQEAIDTAVRALFPDLADDAYDVQGRRVKNVGSPSEEQDVVPKSYVDTQIDPKVDTAGQYAAEAETHKNAAAASESNAAQSESSAAAKLDTFDDRFLGAKSSDPTTDNDGNALIDGAVYWNSASGEWRVWSAGSGAWLGAVSLHTAYYKRDGSNGPMTGDVDINGHRIRNSQDTVPPGAIMPYISATTPEGYLKCNGAEVSRTIYADLFAVLGTAHGNGNGSTTFNLPDFRGVFLRGLDETRGLDVGRSILTYQSDALQDFNGWIRSVWNGGGSISGAFTAYPSNSANKPDTGGNQARDLYFSPINGGARTADETRPKNVAVVFYIKY
ncbi:tail fiber protein [Marivibrio halodurans]|uniref:Tail fiber protein n=1 Tax=Marivibrio halodurans TaxID=2039722 RepID=A0A8J7SJK7_9PROT|nr:phage tail fiber protein [Marivibrio halodurans]MBP5855678.1 tail fiber protein [Marivibrio halodurans]